MIIPQRLCCGTYPKELVQKRVFEPTEILGRARRDLVDHHVRFIRNRAVFFAEKRNTLCSRPRHLWVCDLVFIHPRGTGRSHPIDDPVESLQVIEGRVKNVQYQILRVRGFCGQAANAPQVRPLCGILIGIHKYQRVRLWDKVRIQSLLNARILRRLADALFRESVLSIKDASYTDLIHEKYLNGEMDENAPTLETVTSFLARGRQSEQGGIKPPPHQDTACAARSIRSDIASAGSPRGSQGACGSPRTGR